MTSPLTERFPRTLYAWLKTDDKMLLKAIADGQSVLETAEDLRREHVSVLCRISELEVFEFVAGSEEWVEFMGLALAGVPLKVVIDWCSGSEERLDAKDIEAMAMGDLRPEFAFARDQAITVPNSDCVSDLSWLFVQPQAVQSGYRAAAKAILDRFDVVTPASLKNQVLGIAPPQAPAQWRAAGATSTRASTSKRTTARSGSRTYAKSYRRSPVTTKLFVRAKSTKRYSAKKTVAA